MNAVLWLFLPLLVISVVGIWPVVMCERQSLLRDTVAIIVLAMAGLAIIVVIVSAIVIMDDVFGVRAMSSDDKLFVDTILPISVGFILYIELAQAVQYIRERKMGKT